MPWLLYYVSWKAKLIGDYLQHNGHNGSHLQIIQDETTIVRQAYAENIATIAETALRFVVFKLLFFLLFLFYRKGY